MSINIHHCTNIISFNFCIVGIIWSKCTYHWCSFLLHIQCINTLINILFIINNSSNTFENCRKKANKNNIKYTKCPLADILSLVRTWNITCHGVLLHMAFFSWEVWARTRKKFMCKNVSSNCPRWSSYAHGKWGHCFPFSWSTLLRFRCPFLWWQQML